MTYPIIQPGEQGHCFPVPARKHTNLIIVAFLTSIIVLVVAVAACLKLWEGEQELGIDGQAVWDLSTLDRQLLGACKVKVYKGKKASRVVLLPRLRNFSGSPQGSIWGHWVCFQPRCHLQRSDSLSKLAHSYGLCRPPLCHVLAACQREEPGALSSWANEEKVMGPAPRILTELSDSSAQQPLGGYMANTCCWLWPGLQKAGWD